MIAWFARNSVAANLLMITIIGAGLLSLSNRIPLEVFPSFEVDVVSVSVTLDGATPEDIEQGVTIRIEEAVQDLEGITKIISQSSEGGGSVTFELDSDYDRRDLLADIKSRVDAINTFPAEAENPVVALADRKRDVITVAVTAPYSEKEVREYAEKVRDELLAIDGVTQVELDGIRNYEIAIELSLDKIRELDLTISQVSDIIDNNSVDVSAGNLRTESGDVLIRSKGQAYRKDEFASIPIKTNSDGSIIRLQDIANIQDGFEETPVRTRFNGQQAAFIEVYRIGQQSAIEVADKVKNYIDEHQQSLPKGFTLSYWDDDSMIVKGRISSLVSNAIQGGILVLILLTLFLRPSIAFWVFIGIPVAFMGAFILMPVFGVTLNMMSVFGFILVLGIVVDDAIVTGENIYTHLGTAKSGEQAAIEGTLEVAKPVTFGILTTVAAFLPLAFIEGRRGDVFAQIPYVVIPVLLLSLIESKFILPSHLKHLKLRTEKTKQSKLDYYQQKFADGFEQAILRYYRPALVKTLRYKWTTIMTFSGIFAIILVLILSGWTRFVFFPRIPSETITVSLTMPTGTAFEITNKYIVKIADDARELQEKYTEEDTGESIILNILATTGGRGGTTNAGSVRFEITPPESRASTITSAQLLNEWRKMIGDIPGAEALSYRAELGRSSDPIDVRLSANNVATLEQVADKVIGRLNTYPTVYDIADSLSDGKQELQIELNKQGESLGLTRANVTGQIRNAFFGAQVQRIQRGRDDIKVMLRLPLSERQSLSSLTNLLIDVGNGETVPLSSIATLTPGQSPSSIRRIDRLRTISVTADVDKNNTNMTVLQEDLNQYIADLLIQYPGVSYELEGEAEEQRDSFGSLTTGLVIVLFIIYALLAIPFKSYTQPLVVMSVIPFGAIGAIAGHWIMGMDLTIFSLLGLLALVGIVVNDSLVLVDYINKKRELGMDLLKAILTAGSSRFRPVMLTSLTTFIGLMPLLFEKSTQAQFLIPMAVSLGFGILFATFITLILVPINYLILESVKQQSWLK
ncbi:efflux RND transporter permease subunit [Aliiglaciecola sp. 2_MG-2023]|uniref:efflux RND transporter permease subunit n=1 Tax=unclassified Aliiglaciecola TaxID=2593648 RepID=UPI0026E16D26|nr:MULTISPECIES: efflux RND transporter permease subunit [unclassified Aliiglaciecola]MDO6710709.1 efflux RND transporter permease subunit [Aliiglaciecola sp. 2_MG-2023]MDO6751883.1 efflux RND transporter permease subunit [Aliiglaciecola sp. 1_MG-2023]